MLAELLKSHHFRCPSLALGDEPQRINMYGNDGQVRVRVVVLLRKNSRQVFFLFFVEGSNLCVLSFFIELWMHYGYDNALLVVRRAKPTNWYNGEYGKKGAASAHGR